MEYWSDVTLDIPLEGIRVAEIVNMVLMVCMEEEDQQCCCLRSFDQWFVFRTTLATRYRRNWIHRDI
jgi:hypothetical protein